MGHQCRRSLRGSGLWKGMVWFEREVACHNPNFNPNPNHWSCRVVSQVYISEVTKSTAKKVMKGDGLNLKFKKEVLISPLYQKIELFR